MMRRHSCLIIAVLFWGWTTTLAAADSAKKPLKVFILAGQSNMQGHARAETIHAMRLSPETAPLLKDMVNSDGSYRVCDRVWISSIGSAKEEQTGHLTARFGAESSDPKIGPEFTFGITMEKKYDGPILIIKTAWGGKSLNTDFRPPSAGPYIYPEAQLQKFRDQKKDVDQIVTERAKASGVYYRLMLDHVKSVLADIKRVYPEYDEALGYELAGFVWFQGWNDMVDQGSYPNRDQPGGYDEYSRLMAMFIRDIRKDLEVPKLPFVIGVIGVGGPTSKYGPSQLRYKSVHQNIRDAMAAPAKLPEFQGNVAAVLTENYWDLEVTALRQRESALKPKVDEINKAIKAGDVTREVGQASIEKLYADEFNEREMELLKKSVSNAEFHYLGSARILGPIGKAFADALIEMDQKK
ncbi:MAG: sialate O-acetylesterase [Planctomycetaceae bacterium]